MTFCPNCGVKLIEGTRFCSSCGTQVNIGPVPQSTRSSREEALIKCPSCGAPVDSFQTKCSSCGHEMRTAKMSGNIKDFADRISEFDSQIAVEKNELADNPPNIAKKVGWVILNIITWGIPFVLRSIKRFLFPPVMPLLPTELKKKSYIENYVVPNTKEDILEFVLFASTRVDSLLDRGSEKSIDIGSLNIWAKLWSDKCKQIYARAGIALSGDKQALAQIDNLLVKPKALIAQVKRRGLIKMGAIATVLISFALIFIVPRLGIGVRVPAQKTFEAESVFITGPLDGYINIRSSTVIPDDRGETVTLILEVEAIRSFSDYAENKINDVINERGWQNDITRYELFTYYSHITLGGYRPVTFRQSNSIHELLRVEVGDVRRVQMVLERDRSESRLESVKRLITVMDAPTLLISSMVSYRLENETNQQNAVVDF